MAENQLTYSERALAHPAARVGLVVEASTFRHRTTHSRRG